MHCDGAVRGPISSNTTIRHYSHLSNQRLLPHLILLVNVNVDLGVRSALDVNVCVVFVTRLEALRD